MKAFYIFDMKKHSASTLLSLFTVVLIAFSIGSCTKSADVHDECQYTFKMETKSVGKGLIDYQVTEQDIANYLLFKSLDGISRKETSIVKSVVPIKWKDVPCLYALEYEKGFEVISADKRSPLPLMISKEGKFEMPTEDDPLGFHLLTLAEDVWLSLYQNILPGEPDKESIENMESSLLFWKLIGGDFNTVKELSSNTKSLRDTIVLDPETGHWEQIGVTSQTVVYDTVGHLTTTWWHQWQPFNDYCPYYSLANIFDSRCPAGCTAIAAAQMLYFLHYKIGVPTQSPSTGSCTGYVDGYPNPVSQTFGSFSSETWNKMRSSTDPYHKAALLIGDIGKKLHTEYTDTASYAAVEHLRDSVFHPYGIHCTLFGYYNGNFLKGNLANGYPVVCSGFHQSTRDSGNSGGSGHVFLVDRYIRYCNELTFTYQWVFDDPSLNPGYQIIQTKVIYDSPYITLYQMNWGQGYENNYDNVWCGMNGNWQWGDYSFTHNRKMLCNFTVWGN